MNVSCVIPTRGDCDITPILDTLTWCDDVIVWNNAEREDLGLYARYAAIQKAKHDVIVTQDDDLLVPCWPEILRSYQAGVLTVNYPEPWDVPWVARGAVFDRDLPAKAFARYFQVFEDDEFFRRYACDAVFGLLAEEVRVVFYGTEDLPHAFRDGRMSTSPNWWNANRPAAIERCRQVAA